MPDLTHSTIGPGRLFSSIGDISIFSVGTIPSPNPIPNSGYVSYDYVVNTSLGTTGSRAYNSNIVNTTISTALIDSTKSVNPTNCIVGDTLIYTVVLTNRGNVTANNIIFLDTLPNGTSFIGNSFSINGSIVNGLNPSPPSGATLPNISPNGVLTINFRALVNTIPLTNPITNISTTNYDYIFNPISNATLASSDNSNSVATYVGLMPTPFKLVNKNYAIPGDTLTYSIVIVNNLAVSASNVVLTDTTPINTTFVNNSITLNGVTISGATIEPPFGFAVGTMAPNQATTITYKVTIDTVPSTNLIPNQALARFSYVSNPSLGTVLTQTSASNIENTTISFARITSATKNVDKSFARVNDTLNYTVSFTNTGNTTVENVKLIDTIPNNTTFVNNSVFINGINQLGAIVSPPTGLTIPNFPANSTATITYQVIVNTIPSPNPIPNSGNVSYNYLIDPISITRGSGSLNTNTVNTQVNYANLGIIGKSVDKLFANIGNTLTYTITFKNTGNTIANNVILIDTIPSNTTFVNNSVFINNVANPSTVPVGNVLRIGMGNIAPNVLSTLSFKVLVNTIPSPNPITNICNISYSYILNPITSSTINSSIDTNITSTEVNYANFGILDKAVDRVYATVSDKLTYTIIIINTGNTTANNAIIRDTIPNNTTFDPQSVFINNVQNTTTIPVGNLLTINMGNIGPNALATLSYKVNIDRIPTPNPIPNYANATFVYTVNPSVPNSNSGSSNTNTVRTQVNNADLSGIVKFVNKFYATCNETLTYTISIPNGGNVTANNVILFDSIPNGTSLVANSLLVNGILQSSGNLETGLNIGYIAPRATTTVSYKVTINCN